MLNAKLVVVGGAPEGDEFQLQLPCVLGRSKSASLPLPHPLVSRQHCELLEKEGQLVVRDLGSTNGTFVGSERVEECAIQDGDLLTVGTVTFRAVFSTHPFPAAAPSSEAVVEQDSRETTTTTRIDTGVVGPRARASSSRTASKPV